MRLRWENATHALAKVLEDTMISDLVADGSKAASPCAPTEVPNE